MLRHIADLSRKTCTRMAGACPAYGSGGGVRSAATVTQVPRQMIVKRSKEEEEKIAATFRDVS